MQPIQYTEGELMQNYVWIAQEIGITLEYLTIKKEGPFTNITCAVLLDDVRIAYYFDLENRIEINPCSNTNILPLIRGHIHTYPDYQTALGYSDYKNFNTYNFEELITNLIVHQRKQEFAEQVILLQEFIKKKKKTWRTLYL